jgi:hypothetical protein
MSNETENYFATYAKQLQEKGYDPIPINIRAKAIYDVGWQSRDYSEKIDNPPTRNRGVSLRTKTTPAIDVDVTDPALANSLVEYLHARGFRAFR